MKTKTITFLSVLALIILISAIGQAQSASINVSSQNVKPGERITATFSPVNHTSAWIGFYRVGATDNQFIGYSYLRNSPNGYVVTAPNEAGEYNFRLFGDGGYGKKIATSRTVVVSTVVASSASAFVTVTPSRVRTGDEVTASFSAVDHTSAWIGFYKVGSTDRQLISFAYLRNASNGYKVKVPSEPGEYNFRLFGDGGYSKKIATSNTLTVTDLSTDQAVLAQSGPHYIRVSASHLKPGERLTATFSAVDNSGAWIGFYEVGAADNGYISYSYLRNAPNGYSVNLPQKVGNYHFRLFGDGGYGKKLVTGTTVTVSQVEMPSPTVPPTSTYYINLSSENIRAGQSVTATFSPIANQGAWIGLYKVGSTDRQYISYAYLRNAPNGYTVHISAPGDYQFRLFGDGGYGIKVATSKTITVSR